VGVTRVLGDIGATPDIAELSAVCKAF
jgi:hypothetical protein